MPIYEYKLEGDKRGCPLCRAGFEQLQAIADAPLENCPECGAPVVRIISPPSVGASESGFDDRAKSAGFTKYRKISKGEYEKEY